MGERTTVYDKTGQLVLDAGEMEGYAQLLVGLGYRDLPSSLEAAFKATSSQDRSLRYVLKEMLIIWSLFSSTKAPISEVLHQLFLRVDAHKAQLTENEEWQL